MTPYAHRRGGLAATLAFAMNALTTEEGPRAPRNLRNPEAKSAACRKRRARNRMAAQSRRRNR